MSVDPVDRADVRRRVEAALAAFLGGQRDRLRAIDRGLLPVADAIDALVLGAGKRLRPAFGYWGHRGAGGADSDAVVAALASLELVQAGALIHDDVMDASDTRRGAPAVHRRFETQHRDGGWHGKADTFGEAAAILAGDLCLVWSDEMLSGSGVAPEAMARARVEFDRMRTELTVGQYLDVHAQATADTTVERASKVAKFKSAMYTVQRPLLIGAAFADASAEVRAAYTRYGGALGEAFQLRDDVLGVFGDPAETGKPAGDDLREGKRTYLAATAYAHAGPAARRVLDDDLGDRLLDDARVARLREVIRDSGALDRTEQRIAALAAEAVAALGTVRLAAGAGKVLADLVEASTRRTR